MATLLARVVPLKAAIRRVAKAAPRVAHRMTGKIKTAIKTARKRGALKSINSFQELDLWNRTVITVGIHAKEGTLVEGALTVAQIMTIHEFGAPEAGIPMRSWLRAWFDESQDLLRSQSKQLLALIAKGKLTARVAANRFGSIAQASLQRRWALGIGPALKPATIKRKGSSKQLIDTGQSRTSVTYKVHYK